jgi:hypothetical protein
MSAPTSKLTPEVREHIRRLVDAAPPLTEDQRSRLGVLLRPTAPVPVERKAA